MKKLLQFILILGLLRVGALNAQTPDFSQVGFSTQNGGTKGGQGGTTVTATTFAQLKSYAESSTTYIIMIHGTISNGADGGTIKVGANKSLIGVGSTAFLNGIGLNINSKNNVIIQNLKISLTGVTTRTEKAGVYTKCGDDCTPNILVNGGDCISITGTSKNVWIDHCELFSEDPTKQTNINLYDGLIDIRDQTGFVTISWCYLHDHHKTCLVGASDEDVYADRKVTYHHNYFKNVVKRTPEYRGSTGHVFNNYIKGTSKTEATFCLVNCCLRIEKNVYETFNFMIYTTTGSNKGNAQRIDNIGSQSRAYPPSCTASIPYDYSKVLTNNTADVKTIVPQYSGVGKIGTPCIAQTWYKDGDGDGKGDPNTTQSSCTQPSGFVADKTDLCPNDANKIAPGVCGCGVTETACLDCNGVKNGTATIDQCGICVGGNTGKTACIKDCFGVVNGTATLDNCDRCVGGTTGKTACTSVGEAETDACSYDGVLETKNAGYKGTAYINVDNAVGTKITFYVTAASTGNHTLSIRYANGGTTDRPAKVIVDGTALSSNLSLPSTTAFTTYKTVDFVLNLSAGIHQLELVSATADGLANIDQIGYVSANVSKGSCDEVITNITEGNETRMLMLYPNPSQGSFHIKLTAPADLEISNADGKIIKVFKNTTELEFGDDLQPGVYFAKVGNKVHKFVKY